MLFQCTKIFNFYKLAMYSACENHGTCENTTDNFKCICTEQYEGDTWETRGMLVNSLYVIAQFANFVYFWT